MNIIRKTTTFEESIIDLIDSPFVRHMINIPQHRHVNCLDHSIFVSYMSFIWCEKLGLDQRAAARGGLLHDLFLYNWRDANSHIGMHGLTHPIKALKNATQFFILSEMEKDIILKHMWPITILMPKYKESFIVSCADKACATIEAMGLYDYTLSRTKLSEYLKK